MNRVIVVGAGAAGLWAAARAAEEGARVCLLEKTARTGTKVLASGGTRCNLTTTLEPDAAARLFGTRGERFLRRSFRTLSPRDVRARFEALGVETVEAPLEKVFPRSGRARDVRDALERWARTAGVELRLSAEVLGIERDGQAWSVRLAGGESLTASRLLLCPGGKSYPRTGTTGDGYAWLRSLGLAVVEPVPALAPLVSPAPWVHALTGIALQHVHLRLLDPDGRRVGERRRPIVFTHHGVSGPGAMDLSAPVARAQARSSSGAPGTGAAAVHRLVIDLLPEVGHDELRALLLAAAGASGAPRVATYLGRRFEGLLPRRLFATVLERLGLAPDIRANELARAARHALVETLRAFPIPVSGTAGFDQAEVTAGGLALTEVDPGTLEVRTAPGLYVFGELLDLDGPIGGLNFQAAFATAELAARALARR